MTPPLKKMTTLTPFVLALLLFTSAPLAADEQKTWNIFGVEIADDELFDEEYLRATIEESKSAVIDSINYRYVDGEIHPVEVEPVIFSNMFISAKRFMIFPVICGEYQSALAETSYRFVYLGSSFTFVEEKANDFDSSWDTHCVRP